MILFKNLFLTACILLLISCGGKRALVQKPTESHKEIADEKTRLYFDQAYLNGERAKVLGNKDEAISYYQEALKIYPQSAAAHYSLADLYLNESRPDRAYTQINAAIALDKTNIYYYDLKSQICHMMSKHVEAAEALEVMMKMSPGNVNHYFDAANEYIYAKDYKSALAIYNQMEDRFGVGEDLIRQKEQIYLLLGKPDKAVDELKKLIRAAPAETRYQGMLAELYWTMGKKKESVELYKSILIKEPSNGFAHFGMAEFYRSENKKDQMLWELNEAFKDPRINVQAKMNVIFTLLPIIEEDRSMKKPIFELAETAKNTHPGDAVTHAVLADLYIADMRLDEALKEYSIALDLDPAALEVWKQYCTILLEKGSFKKLQQESDKALEIFPDQAIMYYYNAMAHYQLKNYRDVVSSCKLGLGLYSTEESINMQLYILEGDALHNLGEHSESDKAFDKALEIDPDNGYVLNNYAYYLSVRKVNLEKAKRMSAKTLEMEPNSASYLDTYGWILYQMKDAQGATKYIAKSLDNEPNSTEVLEHMGDVLNELKRHEDAIKYWKKAFELKPDSPTLLKKINGTYTF